MQEGEYDHAGKKFSDALNIDPQNIDSHLGLGWVYLNQSDSENSRKEFEFVKSIAPELAEAYYGLGTLELSNYDFENAVLLLDESLRQNPNNIFAYLFKGYAYYRQGEYSAAESAFQSALKIQPYFYEALIGLGDIRVTRYEFETGMDYYDRAIAADPKRVDAYLPKTGRKKWITDSAVELFDDSELSYASVGIMQDVTDRKTTEAKLRKRESILEAVTFAAEQFLRTSDWRININVVLERLGKEFNASLAYLFEKHLSPDGVLLGSPCYEWVAPGQHSDIDNRGLSKYANA